MIALKENNVSTLEAGKSRKRLSINVVSNVLGLAVRILITLWFTPYLISHLGVATYGLISLANSVTNYMSILTNGLNSAIGRFLTISLARADYRVANRTFNTALLGMVVLVVLLLPVVISFSWAVPYLFDVPSGLDNGVRWLFVAIMGAFLVTGVGSNFAVSLFALQRFELRNTVQTIRYLVRIGLIVMFFAFLPSQLWQVGVAIFMSAVFSFSAYVWLWRKLTPQLRIMPMAFDRSHLRQLTGMSIWMVFDEIGTLLFLNIDLIVVNVFFGAEAAGQYSSVLQFSVLLRMLAPSVAGVLKPVLMTKYARGDSDAVAHISCQAVKFMGLAMALPIGLLCGFSQPILHIWLGPSFESLDTLLVVLTGHLCISLAVHPLFYIPTTLNKVRWPGIATFLMGVANLGLAIAWAKWGSLGFIGVAAAGAIVLTLRNAFFTPIYSARILGLDWWKFLPSILSGILGTLVVGFGAYGLTRIYMPNGWFALIGISVVLAGFYSAGAYFLGLTRVDRQLLQSFLPWKTR